MSSKHQIILVLLFALVVICLSKITSLLFSRSLTPRVTRRTLATTQVGESAEEKMEAGIRLIVHRVNIGYNKEFLGKVNMYP